MAEYTTPKDLTKAYDAIQKKAGDYATLWQYYDGEQPTVYSTERLRKVFQDIKAHFSQNWCAVVIDAAMDRIQFKSFDVSDDESATERLNEIAEEYDLKLEADEAHRAAQVCGEGFIVAWKNDDGEFEICANDPRQVHVFYDEYNPRKASFAAKRWVDSNGFQRITLWYPDRLEYYVSTKQSKDVESAKAFVPADPPSADNPFKKIPVFHYRLERRRCKSALANVIEPQDANNKLMADMMVAAEYGAFKQRYIISAVKTKGQLRNAPNEIWDVPAGADGQQPTQVGEFSETDLSIYYNAMDKLVYSIGVITATPKHYFMGQGGDPSGEALIAMEAPLNKKCQRYIDNFIPTWRQLGAFLLELDGTTISPHEIKPVFERPETMQPRTEAEIRTLNTQAGLPIETTLREFDNWSDGQIEDMHKDKQGAASATPGAPAPPVNPQEARRQQIADLRMKARQAALQPAQPAGVNGSEANGNGGGP